jgi:hypothetical protein
MEMETSRPDAGPNYTSPPPMSGSSPERTPEELVKSQQSRRCWRYESSVGDGGGNYQPSLWSTSESQSCSGATGRKKGDLICKIGLAMLVSKSCKLILAVALGVAGTEAYSFQAAGVLSSSLLSKTTGSVSSLRPAAGFAPKLGPQRSLGLRGGFRTMAMASPSLSAIKTEKLTPQSAGNAPKVNLFEHN